MSRYAVLETVIRLKIGENQSLRNNNNTISNARFARLASVVNDLTMFVFHPKNNGFRREFGLPCGKSCGWKVFIFSSSYFM